MAIAIAVGVLVLLYVSVVSILILTVSMDEMDCADAFAASEEIERAASRKYQYWSLLIGKNLAVKKTVAWLKEQICIQDAGVTSDHSTIWIEQKEGGEIDIVAR